MEQVSRMSAEVNKLIGSSILSGKNVYLPQIGTLHTIVNNEGRKRIDFSSSEQGVSLIEIIKDRAGCTPEQAEEIYNRWKGELYTPVLTQIAEVGELRIKSFITYDSFSQQLNKSQEPQTAAAEPKEEATAAPQSEVRQVVKPTPIPIAIPKLQKTTTMSEPTVTPKVTKPAETKKGGSKLILVLIFIALVIVGGYFGYNAASKAKAEKALIEQIAAQKAAEAQRKADSIALAQIEARKAAEAQAAMEAETPRYRVVYGVYRLRSNVDVALRHIDAQYGAGRGKEYPHYDKTMVSMFESDNRRECQNFLMEYYDMYPDSWVYDSAQ